MPDKKVNYAAKIIADNKKAKEVAAKKAAAKAKDKSKAKKRIRAEKASEVVKTKEIASGNKYSIKDVIAVANNHWEEEEDGKLSGKSKLNKEQLGWVLSDLLEESDQSVPDSAFDIKQYKGVTTITEVTVRLNELAKKG